MIFMVGFLAAAALWLYQRVADPLEERLPVLGVPLTRLQLLLIGAFVLGLAAMETLTFLGDNEPLRIPMAAAMFTGGVWLVMRWRLSQAD